MRDYAVMIKALRWCNDVGKCSECPEDFDCAEKNGSVMREAADAIEELLGQHEADAKEIAWLKKCVQDLPKPPRWISVKNNPPKEYSTPLREKCGLPPVSDTVLITLIDPDVVDGKKDPYKGDRVVIADRFSNGELVQHKMLASQKTRPIAWKPLPKPFVDGGG